MTRRTSRMELYAHLLTETAESGVDSPTLLHLEQEVMRHPAGCLDALAQLVRLPGSMEHELSAGFLMLIGTWLANLRLMAESGRAEADAAIADFQRCLATIAAGGGMDGDMFLALTMVLGEAGIKAAPEVEAAMGAFAEDFIDTDLPTDDAGLAAALDGIAAMAGDHPFAFIAMLKEAGHAMPGGAKAAMAAELARREETSSAGVLLLLDPAREVREAAAEALTDIAGRLDGVALRRLIGLRNWVPEAERGAIDAIARAARAAAVECASWPESRLEDINATSLDGAGAQGFMIVTREGRKRRLSSILTKRGVREAWTAPQTKAEITATLSMARRESGLAVLSRRYLDCAIRHHLHVGLGENLPPPIGLLEIAELIGAHDWTPQTFDWRAELDALVKALPAAVNTDKHRREILQHSEFWSLHDATHDSWFEEGLHVREALASLSKRRDRARATERILTAVIDPARDKWAEHFAWIAFRLHECEEPAATWENFAVLAAALDNGAALSDISVMRAIATRTVEAAWT